VSRLNSVEGISCVTPKGAFYAFPNVSDLLKKRYKGESIGTSLKLAELLLDDARVAVVPGSAFGAEGYVRLSYATSMENIAKGLDRIEEFFKKLD